MFYNHNYNLFFQADVRPEKQGNSNKDNVNASAHKFDFFETDLQPTKALNVINAKPSRPMTEEELAAHHKSAIKFFGLDKLNFIFNSQNTK